MKNNSKNNITELVFILDRSGSMSGLESDTIGGFNAMIEYSAKVEHPDRFELNSATAKIEQSNRRN